MAASAASAARRVRHVLAGLGANECIGEMENRQVDEEVERSASRAGSNAGPAAGRAGASHPVLRHKFVRNTIKIVFADPSAADERYGGSGDMSILEGELLLPPTASKTVFVFMHPSGIQNLLPMPVAMARAGLHVITCASRYPNNDSCLIMEKVALDLGACVRHARDKLGYSRVLLCGWSGGGSLSSFYQAQAERPTVRRTPAGDAVDLAQAALVPADGLLVMAAHVSRAKIFTEWIDPAVLDERDPSVRDVELDLFDPRNPNKAPFSREYVARFRAAQVERNRRITRWAKARLAALEAEQAAQRRGPQDWRAGKRDECFNVYCTQADLRRLDVTLDPNGREPTPIEQLAAENHSPVGLARFTTLRSWLSQWSYDESNADGPESLKAVSVPVFVLANGADHLVPLAHPEAMFAAVPHGNKEYQVIDKATHYYFGQTELMADAIQRIIRWTTAQGLLV
jgi:pimeloyl-ACP methyl ester carboxylesterase